MVLKVKDLQKLILNKNNEHHFEIIKFWFQINLKNYE